MGYKGKVRCHRPAFYSPHSFETPAIIIHTPDARITAASTASRKSHRFFSSLFFSICFLCVMP